ncbi:MAG: dihydroorotase family protein [Thaumarchaeota archaeon]|nr:dihydroorotase family protein [Nitrososphaerota archaeon]
MVHDTVITGAHVVTPGGVVDRSVVIDDGKISGITSGEPQASERIRADGLVCLPGVIDTHVHYGVYTPIDRAAVTESRAAALGGVTTMMRMLRRADAYSASLGPQLEASSRAHHVDYAVHASIFTKEQAAEIDEIAMAGVSSFKLYMNLAGEIGHVHMDLDPGETEPRMGQVNVDDALVADVLRRVSRTGLPVCVHAEDAESCACAMRESRDAGNDGLRAWSESRSPDYEARAIARVCAEARRVGCTIYLVHAGSARALGQARVERARGTRLRVETCPHYLAVSHEGREGYLAKVMPPVRSDADVEAAWAAVMRGDVDTIGTDHVANTRAAKLRGTGVWGALAGFPGVGTSLPILLSEGLNRGRLDLGGVARLTSGNAARIFACDHAKGAIAEGLDADIAIVDTRLERAVDAGELGGHSDYSVYEGMRLKGWPVRTIVRGKTVAEGREVTGRAGHGRLVSPLD